VKPNKQIIKLFLLGLLAMFMLNFPLLSLSSKPSLLFGVPSLYVYIFGVWLVVLVLVFIVLRNPSSGKKKGDNNE
jgi:hypothetical protein